MQVHKENCPPEMESIAQCCHVVDMPQFLSAHHLPPKNENYKTIIPGSGILRCEASLRKAASLSCSELGFVVS